VRFTPEGRAEATRLTKSTAGFVNHPESEPPEGVRA
jgi:hypothetical protein